MTTADDQIQSASRPAESAAGETAGASSWWRRIRDRIWGYDYFISYHWKSGGTYAVVLAQRLRDRAFDVFLDRGDYAGGDHWKNVGKTALANTQRLILIATPEADSDPDLLRLSVEVRTGKRLAQVSRIAEWLSIEEWSSRREQLERSGGPLDVVPRSRVQEKTKAASAE